MTNYKSIASISRASQDKFELWQLLEILDKIKPKKILEIGVHRGGMLETLHLAFPGAELWGIDTDFSQLEFVKFNAIVGDSNDIDVRDQAGTNFDFIFVDGDHNYSAVKNDFELYSPLVNPTGVMAFHDIARLPGAIEGVDVRQFFDEIKTKYPSVEIWNGAIDDQAPGIGVVWL